MSLNKDLIARKLANFTEAASIPGGDASTTQTIKTKVTHRPPSKFSCIKIVENVGQYTELLQLEFKSNFTIFRLETFFQMFYRY
jgi:hypothetical protein